MYILLLFILLLFIIIICCYYNFIHSTNYSGEDQFHVERVNKGVHRHIYTSIYLHDHVDIDQYYLKFCFEFKCLMNDHFKHNHKVLNMLNDELIIEKENDLDEKREITALWESILKNKPSNIYILLGKSRRRLTLVKDHRYFGGLFFLRLTGVLTNTKPVQIYKESYTPIVSEYTLAKLAYYYYNKQNLNVKLKINDNDKIDRLSFMFHFDEIKENVRKQTVVLYYLLILVSKGVDFKALKRNFLRVLIPVAFETKKECCNSVGGIFTEFNPTMSIKDFENMLISRKDHAHASNFAQKFLNKGQSARSEVDIVLSSGLVVSENWKTERRDETVLKSSTSSFMSSSVYPVYIVSLGVDNVSAVTISSMSDDINMDIVRNSLCPSMRTVVQM